MTLILFLFQQDLVRSTPLKKCWPSELQTLSDPSLDPCQLRHHLEGKNYNQTWDSCYMVYRWASLFAADTFLNVGPRILIKKNTFWLEIWPFLPIFQEWTNQFANKKTADSELRLYLKYFAISFNTIDIIVGITLSILQFQKALIILSLRDCT